MFHKRTKSIRERLANVPIYREYSRKNLRNDTVALHTDLPIVELSSIQVALLAGIFINQKVLLSNMRIIYFLYYNMDYYSSLTRGPKLNFKQSQLKTEGFIVHFVAGSESPKMDLPMITFLDDDRP